MIMRSRLRFYIMAGIAAALLLGLRGTARGDQTVTQETELRAGPVRLKFCDGQIRYLYVGDKEIARRVYFAVRDGNWQTALPKFTKMEVHRQANGFKIDLAADCQTARADFHWNAQITGTAEGTIRFTATGAAGRAFDSNRIGICVLYGTPELLNQKFELTASAETAAKETFPQAVAPELVAGKFYTLRYVTETGLTVTADMTGAIFDMEDQRNYGDSSFKAYAPLPYAYPHIPKDVALKQTLTLRVEHAPAVHKTDETNRVTIGALLPDVKIPKLLTAEPNTRDTIFGDINFNRKNFQDKPALTWGINPGVHLPDSDNYMDNVTTIVTQAETAKLFSPQSILHISPIRLDSANWQAGRDPRSAAPFAAAWAARVVKYLASAGVEDAAFDFSPGAASKLLEELAPFAGHALYDVKIHAPGYVPVDALAMDANGVPQVYLINKTDKPISVTVENKSGSPLTVKLTPYQVRKIELADLVIKK